MSLRRTAYYMPDGQAWWGCVCNPLTRSRIGLPEPPERPHGVELRVVAEEANPPLPCQHSRERHFADNGSTSAGCIFWCPDCGAISISSGSYERSWCKPGPDAVARFCEG